MSSVQDGFLDALRERPGDPATLSAYHDWLLENGADEAALARCKPRKAASVADLVGVVMASVVANRDSDEMVFTSVTGQRWMLYHERDCCESVTIEDIVGRLSDLEGSPLTMAEESSNEEKVSGGSNTWTFYRFATVKGYVTVRWFGESNGYYSESVDFKEIQHVLD
jgi:uncharacterized protein (TIGR02996 family)